MFNNTILITGATASGKSDFAIKLAEQVSGEIINADIGSYYKPMTIGTAKPNWKNEKVPHHLFDIIDKPVSYSVTEFRKHVLKLMQDIWQRGNIPIIVGGSAFYIQAFFYKQHDIAGTEPFIEKLEKSEIDTQSLWQELHEIDSNRAQQIDPQDRYRIIRALAIFKATGKKPSLFRPQFDPLSSYHLIVCERDREELYNRIDQRVEIMIGQGWLDEVEKMQNTGWGSFLYRKKMIGYDDVLRHLSDSNRYNLQDTIATIQKRTRNYAKRQITFLKKLKKALGSEILPSNITGNIDSLDLTLCDVGLYIRQLQSQISKRFG